MPGILVRTKSSEAEDFRHDFEVAKSHLLYSNSQIRAATFSCSKMMGVSSGYFLPSVQNSCIENSDVYIWLYGEQYGSKENLAQTLLYAHIENNLLSTLSNIDGYFSALIYDQKANKVYTITDRYGFRPLYIYHESGTLMVSSELKTLTAFSDVNLTIDKTAVQCFYDIGHMLGKMTWFNEVKLLEASTIGIYDLQSKKFSTERYWTWNKIKACSDTFDQAIGKTFHLLKKAVEKRSKDKAMSLALSGGLDSRSILACMPNRLKYTYTFGKKGSEDVSIASQLSKIDSVHHLSLRINENNWYKKRIEGIWKSDGMCSMMHMHASQFHNKLDNLSSVHLNGFAGDLVLGGSWLDKEDIRISEDSSKVYFGEYAQYSNYGSPYFDIEKEDPYYIDTRVKRFTHAGISEASRLLPHRLPFFDNDLIEYVYSLPDSYRKNYKLYLAIYRQYFPEKYSDIPYQKTGAPLFATFPMMYQVKRKLNNGLIKFGLKESGQYAAYSKWFDSKKIVFEGILSSQDAVYQKYIEVDTEELLNESSNNEEKLSRLFTIEVWLQQVLNKKLTTTEEVFGP